MPCAIAARCLQQLAEFVLHRDVCRLRFQHGKAGRLGAVAIRGDQGVELRGRQHVLDRAFDRLLAGGRLANREKVQRRPVVIVRDVLAPQHDGRQRQHGRQGVLDLRLFGGRHEPGDALAQHAGNGLQVFRYGLERARPGRRCRHLDLVGGQGHASRERVLPAGVDRHVEYGFVIEALALHRAPDAHLVLRIKLVAALAPLERDVPAHAAKVVQGAQDAHPVVAVVGVDGFQRAAQFRHLPLGYVPCSHGAGKGRVA
jgi:hypothetical protein